MNWWVAGAIALVLLLNALVILVVRGSPRVDDDLPAADVLAALVRVDG